MDVFKTLKPNEAGTKNLVRKYGEKLVAVRYRKGVNPNKIYTTVELIVHEKVYVPGVTHVPAESAKSTQMMPIRLEYRDIETRKKIQKAGGIWDPEKKFWYLSYQKIRELQLNPLVIKS